MMSTVYRDAFGSFTFAALNKKSIPVHVAVVISPSFIDYSVFFLKSKLISYA